jgi:hypothetical protein
MVEEIKVIKYKKNSDVAVVAIVLAKDWWGLLKHFYHVVQPTDFVVCTWSDFHDGVKSNIEGKQTIAICKKLEHAELIYNVL